MIEEESSEPTAEQISIALDIQACIECSKLGPDGISRALNRCTDGFCEALGRIPKGEMGEMDADDVFAEFLAVAVEAGLCSKHGAEHAWRAVWAIPTAGS